MAKEWKIGDPRGAEAVKGNIEFLERINRVVFKRCGWCKWPIQAGRENKFSDAEVGEICATCHDLRSSVMYMNLQLTDSAHFVRAHEEWKKMMRDWEKRKNKDGNIP